MRSQSHAAGAPGDGAAQNSITIFHNPSCGTSRDTLAAILEAGHAPEVVEYLKTGWRRDQLVHLFERMGARPRDVLRVRGAPAEALGLTAPEVSDAAILDAMVAHPILVERPIVVTSRAWPCVGRLKKCGPFCEIERLHMDQAACCKTIR